MVTLIYSNTQPFLLPRMPFPARTSNREEHFTRWAAAIPSELGTWTVRDIQADSRDDDVSYLGLFPFWRAYPIELGERLGHILHSEHSAAEPHFSALVTRLQDRFKDRFKGKVRWEHYYLDWGYGSCDVTFELEFDSLSQIDSEFRESINSFSKTLSAWRAHFDYEQLEEIGCDTAATNPLRAALRALGVDAALERSRDLYARITNKIRDATRVRPSVSTPAKATAKERTSAPASPQATGITFVYADYFCFIIPEQTIEKTGFISALKRLTNEAVTPKVIEPGLEAFSMAKGEFAFLMTSKEAFHRSRNLCSVGVTLYDAVQAMGSPDGAIPALRRQIAGLGPKKTKRIQNALATLGTVELRVVELGAISRPVRIIGDEFDRAIYNAFWKAQAGAETLETAEWEIKQTRSIMQTSVDAHFSRQQWGLSMVGFFIGALGAANAFRTLVDALQRSTSLLAEEHVPVVTLGLQCGAMCAATYAAIAFFRR